MSVSPGRPPPFLGTVPACYGNHVTVGRVMCLSLAVSIPGPAAAPLPYGYKPGTSHTMYDVVLHFQQQKTLVKYFENVNTESGSCTQWSVFLDLKRPTLQS